MEYMLGHDLQSFLKSCSNQCTTCLHPYFGCQMSQIFSGGKFTLLASWGFSNSRWLNLLTPTARSVHLRTTYRLLQRFQSSHDLSKRGSQFWISAMLITSNVRFAYLPKYTPESIYK